MARGNPNPVQTEEFREKQFQPYGAVPGDVPLAKQVTGVKLPVDVHDWLRTLPDKERVTFLRQVISEAVRQRMKPD